MLRDERSGGTHARFALLRHTKERRGLKQAASSKSGKQKLNKDKCKVNFTLKSRFARPLTFALGAPAAQKYFQIELVVHNLMINNDLPL